jgi:hypothetical protein
MRGVRSKQAMLLHLATDIAVDSSQESPMAGSNETQYRIETVEIYFPQISSQSLDPTPNRVLAFVLPDPGKLISSFRSLTV